MYTPPCYDEDSGRRYPVIWLLHGANADETQWEVVGLTTTADRLIAEGEIPPLVIVLADGLDAMAAYEGDPPPFDSFLLDELRPQVEDDYRTRTDRAHNAIGGISRGGEWALLVASRHPDAFSAVGGHSPAVGGPASPAVGLAAALGRADLRIGLDVGEEDDLRPSVSELGAALSDAGIDHDFTSGPGGHDRAYWASQIDGYLRWYTQPW